MIETGSLVRYQNRPVLGRVQSVWELPGDVSYVVTWSNGQTTTVPDGYLVPVTPRVRPWWEQAAMLSGCGLVILLGVLIPLIGWITLVPLGIWALVNYYRNDT